MSSAGLIPISVATLQPNSAVGLDLFFFPPGSSHPVLFRAGHFPLTERDLARLAESSVTRLFILCEERDRYQTYLRNTLDSLFERGDEPFQARVKTLNELVRDMLSGSFSTGDTGAIVQDAQELGPRAVRLLTSEPELLHDVLRVLHHDYATFTHSANVCYYAVALGRALRYGNEDLEQISVGGLLHDLGKLEIDPRILNKDDKLTEFELRQVRRHPLIGFRKLCRRQDLSFGQLMMVYQHHEKLDGTGYPVGSVGQEIHHWARLCTVVDVFEALTSVRPYRQPYSHEAAIRVMEREMSTTFDPEMLECWKQLILPVTVS
jgi:HD-GYP domain-containing protein (c-di-GMP phosphodiesterase class II)